MFSHDMAFQILQNPFPFAAFLRYACQWAPYIFMRARFHVIYHQNQGIYDLTPFSTVSTTEHFPEWKFGEVHLPGAHEVPVASGTFGVFRPTNEADVVSFTAIND
jgi:hypothetical protein